MAHRDRRWIAAALVVAAATFCAAETHAEADLLRTLRDPADATRVVVQFDRHVAAADARRLDRALVRVVGEIAALLEIDPVPTITVEISRGVTNPTAVVGGRHFLLPADRVLGTAGGEPAIRCRGPALYHLATMLIAESRHPHHGAMLTNGLGVYLEEWFRADAAVPSAAECQAIADPDERFRVLLQRSFPTMGRDIHAATAELAASQGLIPLAEVEAARTQRLFGSRTRMALLQEGSFVRYLIEDRGGIERFLRVYRGEPFEAVYGAPLARLEMDWKKRVGLG